MRESARRAGSSRRTHQRESDLVKKALNTTLAVNRLLRRRRRPAGAAFAVERPDHHLRVATWNVHKCIGTDGKFDPSRTAEVIREIAPDVIALQEVDRRFGDRQGLLDLERLSEETGLRPVPIMGQKRSHGWCGNLILARRAEIGEVRQITLPGLEPRGALIADLELDAFGPVRIIAAHFGLLRHSRRRQMMQVMDAVVDLPHPALLMGDLNEWRPGGKSPFEIATSSFGPLPRAVPSFPSRLPLLALDRIIPNQSGVLSAIRVHDTALARQASDHLPLIAHLTADSPQR